VFNAHDKASQFYTGSAGVQPKDNLKTAAEPVLVSKARRHDGRFLQMCSHHLAVWTGFRVRGGRDRLGRDNSS
jgi:hypothetical protein